MILVCIDSEIGSLDRYECGGSAVRLTHSAIVEGIAAPNGRFHISPNVVRAFRIDPPDRFRVEPPPRPTNPPAAAGRIAA